MRMAKMTSYVPILRGKPGEFSAWRNAGATVWNSTRPVFEVVPTKDPAADLTTFIARVTSDWPPGRVMTVDTAALDQSAVGGTADGPTMWVARALHGHGIPARPVMHLDDAAVVLAEAAAAHELHRGGACLRLGFEKENPDLHATATALSRVLATTGFKSADIDLLIDFQHVDSEQTVGRVVPVAAELVRWATWAGDWRSVIVASGAFPASISNLPTGTHTPLPRHDADLWQRLVTDTKLPIQPDYGDYAVANPTPRTAGWRSNPNLRYTHAGEWWVWRERNNRPGNKSFFTVCRRVVRSAAWTQEQFSWGDHEIHRCSHDTGGAGTATQWRAYGTSHHLATVTDRLARLGVP
jgi:hypothetical protein